LGLGVTPAGCRPHLPGNEVPGPFLFSGTGFGACGPGRVQGETPAWFWF